MSNIYVESLYNENRNAIPSWQGYHYQAMTATFFFLKYILNSFNSNPECVQDISMRVEWLEDFIIFEKDTIKQIYQAKKTLSNVDYTDVMKNFIIQYKILEDDSCKWILVYNEADNASYESITEVYFDTLYDNYISGRIMYEINLLMANRENPDYWITNLKLKYSESELTQTRYYIKKLMQNDRIERKKLSREQCNNFVNSHLEIIRAKTLKQTDDFNKFSSQLEFSKVRIDTLDRDIRLIVNELVTKGFISKNDLISENDIINYLYIFLYEKLMNVRNKGTELFSISFEEVKAIFLDSENMRLLWKDQVFKVREEMLRNISVYCEECGTKECKNCIITQFINLDFCKVIDNSNLEYPKFRPENISRDLRSKLSPEKYNHLIDILFRYKDKVNCITQEHYVELNHGTQKMFVSEHIADDRFSKENLIDNIPEHLDVYKEYNSIITKHFTCNIDYEDLKIVKNLEEKEKIQGGEKKHPKFMDILPISFKSKNHIEEE